MKTKLSLTIIGVIMILQSIAYPLFSETFIEMMFNVGDEAKEVLNLFQNTLQTSPKQLPLKSQHRNLSLRQ